MKNVSKNTISLKETTTTRISKSEFAYLAGYVFFVFLNGVKNSMLNNLFPSMLLNVGNVVFLAMMLVSFFLKKKTTISYLPKTICVELLFVLVAFYSHNTSLLFLSILLVLAYNIKFDRLVKCSLYANIIILCITIIASLAGIIPNYTYLHVLGLNKTIKTAYSLGYVYYGAASYTLFYISLMYMYITYKNSFLLIRCAVLFAINYLMFCYSTARLPFFLFVVSLAMYLFISLNSSFRVDRKSIIRISSLIPSFLLILSLLLSYCYSPANPYLQSINIISSGRLEFSKIAMDRYSIQPFGQEIEMAGGYAKMLNSQLEYFYIDMGYIRLTYLFGIYFTAMMIWLYTKVLKFAASNNDRMLFIWTILICLFQVINDSFISITVVPLLYLAFNLFVNEENYLKWYYQNHN